MAAPRTLAKKPNVIRSAMAYAPALPPHLANAPSSSRPRVPPTPPFFKEQSHRVPTKWSCYRPLLRATYGPRPSPRSANSPSSTLDVRASQATAESVESSTAASTSSSTPKDYPSIRRHIKERWRKKRLLLAEKPTRHFLEQQYDLLSLLTSASPADASTLADLESHFHQQFTRRKAREEEKKKADDQAKALRKPRLVGGYIYPSAFNPPLPRLKPQSEHISMMIKKRVLGREARIAKMRKYRDWMSDMNLEVSFWRRCGVKSEEVDDGPWDTETRKMLVDMGHAFNREKARETMKFSEEDVERVEEARKRRKAWMAEHRPKFKADKRELWADQAQRRAENAERKRVNRKEARRKYEAARARKEGAAGKEDKEAEH